MKSLINQEASWLQSSISRIVIHVGAQCHSPILLQSETCLARVWATWLHDLWIYIREKSWKEALSSQISLMIREILDRCSSPISQSFTNSCLSVSNCTLRMPRSPARIMPSLHAVTSIVKASRLKGCHFALPPLTKDRIESPIKVVFEPSLRRCSPLRLTDAHSRLAWRLS